MASNFTRIRPQNYLAIIDNRIMIEVNASDEPAAKEKLKKYLEGMKDYYRGLSINTKNISMCLIPGTIGCLV